LEALGALGLLSDLDVQFADLVRRATGSEEVAVLHAAALASRAVGEGHACLDLAAQAGRSFPGRPAPAGEPDAEASGSEARRGTVPTLPPLEEWLAALATDAARRIVGGPDDGRPLVLSGTRLYLRRYWDYECLVAAGLAALAADEDVPDVLPADFEDRLAAYFPVGSAGGETSARQRAAARNALVRRLSILSGGPGTGKTYTLARIVALLVEAHGQDRPFRVRIAAPTGKAAARAVESVRAAKATLSGITGSAVLAQVPEDALTLHRLLGPIPNSPYFRHHRDNPLDADLVVVDEASMVDLPLMAKLLDALPPGCRLMLVGDRFQLASVEPGRVYGDLCEAALLSDALRPCMTELTFSHRFSSSPDIGSVATAVNAGSTGAWPVLRACASGKVAQHDVAATGLSADAAFRSVVLNGYQAFLNATEPAAALEAAARFRVLCAVRRGPCGVTAVSRAIERILASVEGRSARRVAPSGSFYDHQLVMVVANEYSLHLFNGDVGVVLRNPETKALAAWFDAAAVSGQAGVRAVPVDLLPEHETAFAVTVHKSQGSEFEHVALVLPTDSGSPVLTRELLYTGITRAKERLDVWCTEAAFAAAVARRTQRSSGLAAVLSRC
jgi:exodeoxyribonuclease V alpha subunit